MYGINDDNIKEVNAARHYLAHRNKEFENMPPCYDTLHLLLQRVTYVAGFIWGNSLVEAPILPSFEDYAFMKLAFRFVQVRI